MRPVRRLHRIPTATNAANEPRRRDAEVAAGTASPAGSSRCVMGLFVGTIRRRPLPYPLALPVAAHLRQTFHVDAGLLALLFGLQRLQQIDRVRQVIRDRLTRRVEVNASNLGECRWGI